MIRVLHVLGGTNRGGAETFVMNLFRNINRDDFKLDILSHSDKPGDYDEEIRSLGGRIFYISSNPKRHKVLRVLSRYIRLLRFFKDNDYRVIHIHTNSVACLPELAAAALSGIKIRIAHSHSTSSLNRRLHARFRFLLKYLTTYQLACGSDAGQWLFGRRFERLKGHRIIENAIRLEDFRFDASTADRVRDELMLRGKTVLGHVGRFIAVKNHSFLIDIFCEFIKLMPDSVLLLIGQGELERDIKEAALTKGVADKVLFLGVREDVNRLLMGMDCFVLPSLYEGLPIVTIEAQASGLPLVVSDRVSAECNITGDVVFEALSMPAAVWARTIAGALGDKSSRPAAGDRLLSSSYNIKNMVPVIEEIYRGEVR